MTTTADRPGSGAPRRAGPARRWAVDAAARRWAVDAAIAVAVTAAQLGAAYAGSSWHPGAARAGTLSYLLLAVGGAALILRRRYPVGVLAVTLATTLWAAGQNSRTLYLALIVAFFTAVLAKKRIAAIGSLVIGYAASVWPFLIGQSGHPSATFAVGLAAGLIFLLSAAELIRSRNQRTAALARSRAEELRRMAGEERMKMARDLHDVVAHNISVINVQANTALHLMDRQPERARMALTTINDVSKQALVELRSVLGVLRDVDEAAPRSPSPGLARLGDLVDSAAAAGLTVHVEPPEGPALLPSSLPAEVDLAAYRIVQEALTNSARHSGGRTATVRISQRSGGLLVEVADNGKTRPSGSGSGSGAGSGSGSGSRHGIAGMTERAKVLGGTLHAGPRPGGGFGVRAWLPVDRSEP
ncbi:MAG: histidine kinase [Streptosporangiaceae bacterium]|jgi:signal transduction histidine kinase